ncbi:MAG TPA: DUF2723 domain-containing protein [Bacteroidota bacterium]|nr:DUF2723 domain-containing protein [Bacteroidota bacterium]
MIPLRRRLAAGALCSGAIALAVYLRTVAPGLDFIDSGELSTVACTLGIAHPTGYPLFTMLGWICSHLPVAGSAVGRLNIMSAILCALSVAVFVLLFRRVCMLALKKSSGESSFILPACTGALMLAFSSTFWSQALVIEVYPLHLLLVSLALLTFFRANEPLPGEERGGSSWLIFAYAVGLSFTNHMTTVLLAPGLLYLYFSRQGSTEASWKRLLRMSIPFAAALSLYLYLPLRASTGPLMSWGNVVTPERFLWHVTGKQYRVWMFSSMDVVGRQLSYFVNDLPGEFTVVGLLLAVIGAVVLARAHRRLAAGVGLLFLGCIFYAANYDIHDIDSYFLLAYICVAMAVALGSAWLTVRLGRLSPAIGRWGGAALVALCAIPLAVHYGEVDESANYLVEDYTANMFASLRENAVVISYQWDYWVSASYYAQLVEGVRPDVTVIDKELLRRSWYLKELERRHPRLIEASRAEVNAFLAEVSLFEHDLPYDPARIEARYAAMIGSFIRRSLPAHPVYVTGEIEPSYTQGFYRVPEGMAFRLSTVAGDVPAPFPPIRYRSFPRRGRLEDLVRRFYADAWLARGEYLLGELHDPSEARKCAEFARLYDPDSQRLRRLLSLVPR